LEDLGVFFMYFILLSNHDDQDHENIFVIGKSRKKHANFRHGLYVFAQVKFFAYVTKKRRL